MHDVKAALARQSLARSLLPPEELLATAMETQFREAGHDLGRLVETLNSAGVARPSGEQGPWSEQVLEAELSRINLDLDAAERTRGSVETLGVKSALSRGDRPF